ncbi:MAG: S8 family serine peptidase [Kiritimatiellae bacterium]|nr:S8 family serine peptidase [Kiritimatiellia bacterium]
MHFRQTIPALIAFTLAATPALALEVRLEGDRLSISTRNDDLREVLGYFVHAGVSVRIDPRIRARVTGRFKDAEVETALKELLAPFGYALIWDVVEGPLGPLPKLAEIQVFRPGAEKNLEPILPESSNLDVTTGPAGGPPFVKDEILISVRPGMRLDEFRRLIAQIGGTVVDSVPELGIYRVRLVPGINIPALVEQVAKNPNIHTAEPNYVFPQPAPQPGDAGTDASPRPRSAADGAAPVAILDSGLLSLEALNAAILGRYDALQPDREITDPAGHGTQMALVASGAVLPGGAGAEGESPSVPILAVRAFDENGNASSFALARSIAYALGGGARVLNLSWGSETGSDFLANAIAYAQSKGLLVVAAAGNEPTGRALYPAAYPGVVAVSATSAGATRWENSNYGDFVFVAAPGFASFPVGYNGPPGSYAGTSISSAYVSRALARYLTLHPAATRAQALEALKSALTDAGAKGKDPQYGYGVLDEAALGRLLAAP